jgi:hypothetical protein
VGKSSQKRRLSPEQRRALELLAGSPHGVTEPLLVHGHGFSRVVLASLVRRRLTSTERVVVMVGGKMIEAIQVRITAAGRGAIEE